jgi:NAD(P)-dependent dehydrogenase (short-subunit alcohol dehydrogenase family)
VQEAGRQAVAVPTDLSQAASCRRLVARAVQELGRIDVLVNNAAFQMSHQGIEDLPDEELEHTFRINVFAMFYLCKAAVPHMQPGSTIVNTTSIQAYQPSASLLAYASTKGAILTFTKALSQALIKQGIRVNAVAPGPVWTPLIVSATPEGQVKQFGQSAPEGRAAQPVELASAYVFLASQESSYISGEVIGVTGGSPLA